MLSGILATLRARLLTSSSLAQEAARDGQTLTNGFFQNTVVAPFRLKLFLSPTRWRQAYRSLAARQFATLVMLLASLTAFSSLAQVARARSTTSVAG